MSIQAKQVEITPVEENLDGELAKEIYCECGFCSKRMALHSFSRHLCESLSDSQYYCSFCLRHNFYTKNNRNVLLTTFRTIISYYHRELYLNPLTADKKMYLTEIKSYIDSHVKVGLLNPAFSYDPETYTWFIDFSRVGKGNKKLKLSDILKTIINILACFNIKVHIPHTSTYTMYDKYKEAIEKFYASRYRPAGRPVLAPTISVYKGEEYRDFTSDMLV